MPAEPGAAGILLEVEDGALVVDVIGNGIVGSGYGYGIRHRLYDATVLDARLLGNLVVGANLEGSAAITVEGFTSDGTVDARIINNTLVDNATGIRVAGSDAVIANNLVRSHAVGLAIASTGVSNRNNLVADNDTDFVGTSAGPGTVFDAPSFVGPSDYRLASGSPGIDDGDSAAVPPELTTDLAGQPRIQGAAVDIGAYEAPEPDGAAVVALATVLALGSCWRRRAANAGRGESTRA
jgi:hypothetical protein